MREIISPRSVRPSRRRIDIAVIALFLALITLPGLGMIAGVDSAPVSAVEMRTLASWPRWSWTREAIAAWPRQFEHYFEDHFGFRNLLIQWQTAFVWRVLETSPSNTVIGGRQDWLFYADDGGLQDYVQDTPFTADDLVRWRRTLERTRDWLAARGTRFVFVLAPDKQMIYPEFMPASLQRMRGASREDQLLTYMQQHSTVDVVDLRPGILSAKRSELLYHRYDTHWNDRGALIGYQEIAGRLGRWFPRIHPLQRSDFVTSTGVLSGDGNTLLGLTDEGKRALPGLVPRRGRQAVTIEPTHPNAYGEDGTVITEIPNSDLPRAVMFRDSFSSRLIPYLSEHFSRIVYQWQNDFDDELVARERPDVVIQEMVGRHLYIFMPSPELVPLVSRTAQ